MRGGLITAAGAEGGRAPVRDHVISANKSAARHITIRAQLVSDELTRHQSYEQMSALHTLRVPSCYRALSRLTFNSFNDDTVSRERQYTDTNGTVLVRWEGHFHAEM